MSWVMRIQNQNSSLDMSDVPTLFLPSLIKRDNSGAAFLGPADKIAVDVSFAPLFFFSTTPYKPLYLRQTKIDFAQIAGYNYASHLRYPKQ